MVAADAGPRYCDVALPVPLDRTFTYLLPETLRRRVAPGARVVAPFGPRKLVGVVARVHAEEPAVEVREVLRLLDEEPALPEDLLGLGRWISEYYRAPLGETLKAMLPLGIETRSGAVVALSERGVEAARQFSTAAPDDPTAAVLRALVKRPLSETYLKKKLPGAARVLGALRRKGLIEIADEIEDRDPLRARDGRLLVSLGDAAKAPAKPKKGERLLLEYLVAHPGEHDVETLAAERRDAATVARRLEKLGAVRLRVARPRPAAAIEAVEHELSSMQSAAFLALAESIRSPRFETFLLHGVTGSGKTEVYMRAIDTALAAGKGALLMVPEIGLTPAVAGQFFERFGDQVAILHSGFAGWRRAEQWRRLRTGEARVAVGTRSGVFAPIRDLGLIIVDEEHEAGYKQDETPRYHGRDVAVVRGRDAGATVVLGSATPSLETRRNAETGKYRLLEMPRRVGRRPLPEVEVVDMREEFKRTRRNELFSEALTEQLRLKLAAGEQAMILLNRRGFSTFVMCRACGERVECQNCSVTLHYHKRERRLLCHYCDYAEPPPEKCPKCGDESIYFAGSGSEKVEDALRNLFPRARVARLDRDSVKGRDHYERILGSFREGRFDILVGTQMIAKGHDIPNVTLVGVVSADVGLGMPDFRAAERTFQLLTQVAGRAGRGELPGRVVLQTMEPEHYAVAFAAAQDYAGFYAREIRFRERMHYPPFAALALLRVRSRKLEEALAWSGRLGAALRDLSSSARVMGPATAPVAKLKNEYRFQFLIKSDGRKQLGELLRRARAFAEADGWPPTALIIDVDPMSLM